MVLPPVLQVGLHRLALLAVSRDAGAASGNRRSSDSLLNAFCFVGELQSTAADTSSSVVSVAATEGASDVAITWYYSPLFQYERKRIRVEESVIDAALTKALTGSRHAEVNQTPLDLADVDALESVASDQTHSMADTAADANAPSPSSTTTPPALYVRLGTSTTFREYKLVVPEPPSPPPELSSAVNFGAVEAAATDEKVTVPRHTPPVLRPLAPKRPSLTPINTSGNVNHVRSALRLTHKRAADLHRSAARASSEETPDEAVAAAGESRRAPPVPSPTDDGAASYSPLRPTSEQREPYDAAFPMPVSLAHGGSPSLRRASLAAQSPQLTLYANHWETPETSERKASTPEGPPPAPAVVSSASSAFLSSSLFFSCAGSQAATSVLSTARSAATDMEGRLSASMGGSGMSGRFFDETKLQSHESAQASSAVCPLLSRSTSCPTPPPALSRPGVRRRPFRTLGGDGGSGGRPSSSFTKRTAPPPGHRLELEMARAATPPGAH